MLSGFTHRPTRDFLADVETYSKRSLFNSLS